MTVEERVAALESNSAIVPAISASATLTLGYDLNSNQVGFQNSEDISAKITWYDDASISKGGEGWYGSIEVDHITFKMSTDLDAAGDTATIDNTASDALSVTAKITNGSVYATIYGAPGAINETAQVDQAEFDSGDAASPSTAGRAAVLKPLYANASGNIQGLTIGYGSGMISDISLDIVSDGDWTQNTNNDFGVKANLDLVPMDLLEVKANALYGMFQASQAVVGFGVQPIITVSSIMNGLDVTLGFDGQSAGSFSWDASAGIVLNLAPENADGDQDNVAVKALYASDGQIDSSVAIALNTAGGVMDGVGFKTTVTLTDLTAVNGAMGYGFDVWAEYNKGGLNPFAELYMDSAPVTAVQVGVSLTSDLTGIENTTFTLKYYTQDVSADKGLITFATEIAY
jgi:hypothetical protein